MKLIHLLSLLGVAALLEQLADRRRRALSRPIEPPPNPHAADTPAAALPPWPPVSSASESAVPADGSGGVLRLLKATAKEWSKDNVPRLSASLAYYTVFSMAPLFVLILMLIGQIFGPDAVRNELDTQLTSVMGRKAAEAVQSMVQSSMLAESRTLALVTGSITLLLGATGIFKELKAALNTIWEAAPPKDQPFVWSWSRTRLLSLGMVAVIMFMMIASMIISAGISFAARHLGEWFPIAPVVWVGAGLAAGLALETTLFALLFRVLPDVRLPTRDIWWGAAVTAVLFEGGKWVLGWYLGRESTLSAYGAAGSIMLVLLWVYYTSIILLTGAELTQVRSRMRGMHDNPSPIPAG